MLARIEQWIFPPTCCLCGLSSISSNKFFRIPVGDIHPCIRRFPIPGIDAPPSHSEKLVGPCTSSSSPDFCGVCIELLPWTFDRCFRCARPLDMAEAIYCETCRERPPCFDRTSALFSYEPPINRMISKFKFSGDLAYGRILGTLLAQTLQADSHRYPLPQALVPVPLHHKRWVHRGFNQAQELALVAHHTLGIPLLDKIGMRVKETPAQSTLDKCKRKTNLKKAFRIQALEHLPFEHVAIIDDVVTTGSTVDALAAVLKDAGVEQVDVWCIARA